MSGGSVINLQRLDASLQDCAPLAIAVSGGVDSMTLAHRAAARIGGRAMMVHAASPAVPLSATARVREHARRHDWQLVVLDAGEFEDPAYLANPVNRCFFCKTNLYRSLMEETDRQLVSGTNLDDLGDFRPGLEAAAQRFVRHPFVEAGMDKSAVRALARAMKLDDLAELPSAPCLASRIETGIDIDPEVLPRVDAVEELMRDLLDTKTVRCRVRRTGIVIELEAETYRKLRGENAARLRGRIAELMQRSTEEVSFAVYRRGSAFVRVESGPNATAEVGV